MSPDRSYLRDRSSIFARLRRLPVTTITCVTGIVLSLAGWSSLGYEPFAVDGRALGLEPWRLMSAHFVHADLFHLFGNLMWIWLFGQALEPRLGHRGLVAFLLFVSIGGSLAEHAFDHGAIGLSGVTYGMWAFLLLVGWRFPDLRRLVSRSVHLGFLAWFFLGMVISAMGWVPISNIGHAAGAVLGAVVAVLVGPDLRLARGKLAVPAAVLFALVLGATVARDRINLNAYTDPDAWAGQAAMEREDWTAAEAHFARAVAADPRDAWSWWNLGCALERAGKTRAGLDAAFSAYEAGLPDEECLAWLVDSLVRGTTEDLAANQADSALVLAQRALRVAKGRDPEQERRAWWNLTCAHAHRTERREAADAGQRAFELGRHDAETIEWLTGNLAHVTSEEFDAGRFESALAYARRGVELAPDAAPLWENVRLAAERAGDAAWIERAKAELSRLSPLPK